MWPFSYWAQSRPRGSNTADIKRCAALSKRLQGAAVGGKWQDISEITLPSVRWPFPQRTSTWSHFMLFIPRLVSLLNNANVISSPRKKLIIGEGGLPVQASPRCLQPRLLVIKNVLSTAQWCEPNPTPLQSKSQQTSLQRWREIIVVRLWHVQPLSSLVVSNLMILYSHQGQRRRGGAWVGITQRLKCKASSMKPGWFQPASMLSWKTQTTASLKISDANKMFQFQRKHTLSLARVVGFNTAPFSPYSVTRCDHMILPLTFYINHFSSAWVRADHTRSTVWMSASCRAAM